MRRIFSTRVFARSAGLGLAALLTVTLNTSCNDDGDKETASDDFDVQFVLPAGIELSDSLVTFTVIDGKAPLMTDYFVFEPVGQADNVSYSYPCPITETSSISFTVEIPYSLSSGQYGAYISRGSERKAYGELYLAYVRIGETLPNWFEGELDVHLINTGRGESTYQILPDGTTILVDASGALTNDTHGLAVFKPNANVTSGQAIVDYINHFSPAVSAGHINYFLATHHHGDHIGEYSSTLSNHSSGEFRLTSICEIGSKLVIDKFFDRDWPDFSYPSAWTGNLKTNLTAFLNWTSRTNGTVCEKWKVGSHTQMTPVNSGDWDVDIRNYAGNGYFWTGGADDETFTTFPTPEEAATIDDSNMENRLSCAYVISYGKFDIFLGGDMSYTGSYSYSNAEKPLVGIIPRVEVMKSNHHCCADANSSEFLSCLNPDVIIVGVWTNIIQPGLDAMNRIYSLNTGCDVYCTYQSEDNIATIGQDLVDRMAGTDGHIVVRVAPGGDSYRVYMLYDDDEEYRIKSIHGPYYCSY